MDKSEIVLIIKIYFMLIKKISEHRNIFSSSSSSFYIKQPNFVVINYTTKKKKLLFGNKPKKNICVYI